MTTRPKILGMEIKGLIVQSVLVTPAEEIATEAYLGVLMDRKGQAPLFMASPAGGIDIEEVARETPEKLRKLRVDPRYGLLPHQAYWIADFLYDDPAQIKQAARIVEQLWHAFIDSGASMVEINPLITTTSGEVKAIDAKISVDDNELFRHPEDSRYAGRDLRACGRDARARSQPELREARWCGRVLREWCGAGDGNHGPW